MERQLEKLYEENWELKQKLDVNRALLRSQKRAKKALHFTKLSNDVTVSYFKRLKEIMQLNRKLHLYIISLFFLTQHNVMCAFVKGGFCLTKNQRKQRAENSKWFLEVYTPEVARLKRSINAIYKDDIKILTRIADVKTKIDKYYAPIQRVILTSCIFLLM